MRQMSWEEVYTRLKGAPEGKLYGVPRGGSVIAGLTGRAVNSPEEADAIVDDLIITGTTRERYSHFGLPFWSLFDKRAQPERWIEFPWEVGKTEGDIEDTVRRQIEFIGEDPRREGLVETPRRVVRSFIEMTSGYRDDPEKLLSTSFTENYDEMVVVQNVGFWSLCEHHMVPFHGKAHIGYIPNGKVVGLSKLARLVECYAKRLQIQERMTQQIAHAIETHMKPLGVGVVVNARHLCMEMRGVKSAGAVTVTSCLLGVFRETAREEFLSLVRQCSTP